MPLLSSILLTPVITLIVLLLMPQRAVRGYSADLRLQRLIDLRIESATLDEL